MKHAETLPTCPICSAKMEESKRGQIAVAYNCQNCGFETDIDIVTVYKENLIIKGYYDNEMD